MKYIDAEKLLDEINRLKGLLNSSLCRCLTADYKAGGNKQLDLLLSFIDSLRQEQPSWKPSKEQMEALLNTLHPDDPYYPDLKSLYEQLKKLM